ncbi:hypothetical protein D3C72_1305550 [compost metagenome]
MSSSKISDFRSASSLKRRKAALTSASDSREMPSSCSRCLKALRPDSLPSTILLAVQPTSSARMISYVSRAFKMPSWWMPDACAKAFAPTTALFGCTAKPVICDTILDAATICVVSMPTVKL